MVENATGVGAGSLNTNGTRYQHGIWNKIIYKRPGNIYQVAGPNVVPGGVWRYGVPRASAVFM